MTVKENKNDSLIFSLELLKRIPKKRKVSAKELHEQLSDIGIERDIRTIQRQLVMLSDHFDIERDDRSKPYGYRWKEFAQGLALPMLTEQESLILALSQHYLKNIFPSKLMKSMRGFFEQAKLNLDLADHNSLDKEWLDKVCIAEKTLRLIPPEIDPDIFEEVSKALYTNRWLHITYCRVSGSSRDYEIMPLGLAQQGIVLYLVVRFKGYENERSLAIHRIKHAKGSTIIFKRPKEFSLRKYENDGRFAFGEGKRVKLSFKITKTAGAHLLETPLSLDQIIEVKDKWFVISATVLESAKLTWWLRGFGDEVWGVTKC